MRLFARWLALLVLAVSPAAKAAGSSFSGLYVFGDSLVDSGNAYLATGGSVPNAKDGYVGGRFSNGFNFADYLSVMITGKPTTAAFGGGRNLAVGGATAAFDVNEVSPSFPSQVGAYQKFVGPSIDSNALVLISFGGNDVRDTLGDAGPVSFKNAIDSFAYALDQLYKLGARNVVIVGAPDIGLLPESAALTIGMPGRLEDLTKRSQQINVALQALTAGFGTLPGAKSTYFDLFGYEHDLLANPTTYGLPSTLDTKTPCQIPGSGSPQGANCGNALYFDAIHPTTQVHRVIATAIAGQLGISAVPEGQVWVMLILGFGAAGASLRRRRIAAAIA